MIGVKDDEDLLVQVLVCEMARLVEDDPSPRVEIPEERHLEMIPYCQVRGRCVGCRVRECSPRHGETSQHRHVLVPCVINSQLTWG